MDEQTEQYRKAQKRLMLFIEQVDRGYTPSLSDCELIADAFRRILYRGEPAAEALGLAGHGNRPPKGPAGERLEQEAVDEVRALISDGVKAYHAYLEVAERYSKHWTTIRDWCKKHPHGSPKSWFDAYRDAED